AVLRADGELYVRASGLDADLAYDADSHVAQVLVLDIGQSLRGRDRDGVARVHAHRVEVLNRADDDDVVGEVAHHLKLELLPAEYRLFDENLADGRGGEPSAHYLLKLFGVVGGAAARPAERERGATDCGVASLLYD